MIYTQNLPQAAAGATRSLALFFSLPFDVAREQYASAVRVGLIEPSMLAGAQFARTLSAMEKATLGPWARQV
jgi:hypothetical protein